MRNGRDTDVRGPDVGDATLDCIELFAKGLRRPQREARVRAGRLVAGRTDVQLDDGPEGVVGAEGDDQVFDLAVRSLIRLAISS